jgi:eukaryotic-like serine/threonine-protein kinase
MLEPTATRFYQAALQSGLADAPALLTCWDAIPADKRVAEHIDRRFARQAVQSGVLTLWQAQQLIAGRSTGFKIDRYTLLELIGQGGMGRVYLAKDTRLNRRVALKILSPERVNNPRAIARFHREALVGAQLQHENLVRIYDEGESNGKCYLVMEYIEGKNIGQMIAENGPIPPAIAARLARQVALGLEHAQRKGLIHRDVNPYNILVNHDGAAKLTDLGLAIDLAESERVTRDGATVGTFDYVSPEQARHSHSVDTRSDIYSLGCTFYHMLAGQVPFPSASLPEKLFGHQAREPEPLTNLAPGVPAALAAVVSRTMRKKPDDRYATPLELAQALEPFADETAAIIAELAPAARYPSRGGATPVTQQFHSPAGSVGAVTPVAVTPPSEMPTVTSAPVLPTPLPSALPVAVTENEPETMLAAVVTYKTTPAPAPTPTLAKDKNGVRGLNLQVDLGPEPPLSQGSLSTRSKSKPQTTTPTPVAGSGGPRAGVGNSEGALDLKRGLTIAAAAAGLFVVVAGAAVAYRHFEGNDATADATGHAAGTSTGQSTAAVKKSKLRMPQGKEVRVVAADGSEVNEPNLSSAMHAAIGGRGHVLLLNKEPLNVSAAEAVTLSGGTLVIRAGEGVKPVLHVEVKAGTPFLSTRSSTPLKMEQVAIVVKYLDPGSDPAPVILAGGNVTLDRCDFRVEGQVPGARAVAVEGGTLSATGCWFENFDRALDIACFGGADSQLGQCMFVHSLPVGANTSASRSSGWAVRLRSMPGGFAKNSRRLVLDRCTAKGQGLLDLVGFSPEAPVIVDPTACAVQAETLLSWEPDAPPDKESDSLNRQALSWSGKDNQYDILGKSWVVLGAKNGLPATPMPGGPTDLDSWIRLLGNERDPIPPPIRFATDPAALPAHPESSDFVLTGQGSRSAGAEASRVGPGARTAVAVGRKP